MNNKIKNWLLNKVRNNQLVNFLNLEDVSGFIKYNVRNITREEYFADPINTIISIIHFPGIINRVQLNKGEREKLDVISLLIFSFPFILSILNSKNGFSSIILVLSKSV